MHGQELIGNLERLNEVINTNSDGLEKRITLEKVKIDG